MLFIEGEAAKYKVSVMAEHLAFKDTTIQLQKKRILSTDSLDAIKDFQYKVTANFLTAEAKRQNTNKRIYQRYHSTCNAFTRSITISLTNPT